MDYGQLYAFCRAGRLYIASDATWIESNAIQQLITTATIADGMTVVAGMPDLHPAEAIRWVRHFSEGRFIPRWSVTIIGCGMALYQTELKISKLNADKAGKQLRSMHDHADADWLAEHVSDHSASHRLPLLSSVGGGNHFASFQQPIRSVMTGVCRVQTG